MQSLEKTKIYNYETFPNDPNEVRIYTLENGLKVYLAQNFNAPRIQTYIPVRTGSNNDPKDNTGLAHYLEHMMFKGSSLLGTTNWEKEKVLLDQISALYEKHKAETHPENKKQIYKEINRISQEASQYALANEYDKLMASIGASGTNAHTWLDETVYKNNIPKNELRKWLKIESNRFSDLVLRLFHTELEAVYEEFNRSQDNDSRLVYDALLKALFPTHPNGQQTTLGSAEHLRNPSMEAIKKYFSTYYVPNNMALVLVGDLDFDETIANVDEFFGNLKYRALPPKIKIEEKPIAEIQKIRLKSPSSPRLQMGWRTESYGSSGSHKAEIVSQILSNNGETGLLDVHINQEQKALRAMAYHSPFKNYGFLSVAILPKENQSLEEVEKLVLSEIEKLKKGDFPDWLIPAIVQDIQLWRTKEWESANGLATSLYESFINETNWEDEINEIKKIEKITKREIIDFAQDFFKENYVVVYKEFGENENLIRVDPPEITPIKINKSGQSEFFKSILKEKETPIEPKFVDYSEEIHSTKLEGKKISFVENRVNDLAQVIYIFPFGTDHDKELGIAINFLEYLGTDRFSPEELKAEFYKLGISYEARIKADEIQLELEGPENNMEKGLALLHHWFSHANPKEDIYAETIETILQGRIYAKKDKNRIAKNLLNYGKFGVDSRVRDVISEERLREINAADLVDKVKNILFFPYQIYFYGRNFEEFKKTISAFILPEKHTVPEPKFFPEPETSGKVYFVHYDSVQVDIYNVGRGNFVNPNSFGAIKVYNEYFGKGLSSIVFQEIREARSLAYSTYADYSYPKVLDRRDYLTTYVGTQANKLILAKEAMEELLSEFPMVESQFSNAKENALKQMASSRISRRKLFFQHLALQKYGISHDLREDIYHEIKDLDLNGLHDFYREKIQPIRFNTVIMGDRKILEPYFSHFSEVTELSLEEIFGY